MYLWAKGPSLPVLIQLFLYQWQEHLPVLLFMNPVSVLSWVSGARSSGTKLEALAVTAAHTAFIHGNGSNRLLVSSFCPSSVVPHLTPKEEVTAVALNTSAIHSAESLPLLPLPTSSYSYPDFNNLPGITAGNHFALMLSWTVVMIKNMSSHRKFTNFCLFQW